MALPRFPDMPSNMAWPVKSTTRAGSTLTFRASSGRRADAPLWAYPLYEWEISFSGLSSTDALYPGLGARSLQILKGFYLAQRGRLLPFIYQDPTDCVQEGAVLGVGDGTTVNFIPSRNVGAFSEPVDTVLSVDQVYANGVAVDSATWNIVAPNGVDANAIGFSSAPAEGSVLTLDFQFGFKCKFSDDDFEFTNIMRHLWTADSLKFERVRIQ